MSKMLINATRNDELRSVMLDENNKLINYDVDTPELEQKKSNIYKAVITSIENSLCALFVNFGSERTGFLPFSNISPEYYDASGSRQQNPDLRKLFKMGQELVVQVEKDERGTKGAALTTYISLAGAYCVLMPNNARSGGISRQIEGKEREELSAKVDAINCPEGMSLIVRTAGVNRSKEELEWDMSILLHYWEAIKQAAIAKPGPYLIHQESNIVLRSVRDNLREEIAEVIIDDEASFNEVHEYIQLVRPDFLDRIKLHNDPTPLFSKYGAEKQIAMAYSHEVRLPSGGSIVIDHTEALISIDVNSARATKAGNIEETAFQTNMEAASEVARQLRIRDLGGLIVIDFIDMSPPGNRREVENTLREALKIDRARIQMERISRFGLLEMSRQRLRRALSKTIKITCPRCQGQGMIQSVESLSSTIIHHAEEQLAKAGRPLIFTLQAPIDLATYFINERRDSILELEKDNATQVIVIPNPNMQTPDYTIKVSEASSEANNNIPSYQQIKKVKSTQPVKTQKKTAKTFDEPIMNQYLSMPDAPSSLSNGGTGVFKRLIGRMFGDEKTETEEPTKTPAKKPAAKKASQSKRAAPKTQKPRSQSKRPAAANREKPAGNKTNNTEKKPSNTQKTRRGTRGGMAKQSPSISEQENATTSSPVEKETKSTPTRKTRPPRSTNAPRSNAPRTRNSANEQEKTVDKQEHKPKNTTPPAEKPKAQTEKPKTQAPAEKQEAPKTAPARRSLSSAKQAPRTASRPNGARGKPPKVVKKQIKRRTPAATPASAAETKAPTTTDSES